MIKLRRKPLRKRDQTCLEIWQRRITGVPPHDPRIGTTWDAFTREKQLRQRVARWLHYQCIGRCVYCERNEFETIDHYYPKAQFPAYAFAWWNFGAACWTCNRNKGTILPFQSCEPMIINPLDEDPLAYFYVDPRSGLMAPALHLTHGSVPFERADYTITKLQLNERGLPKERRLAASDLRRALHIYRETGGHRSAERAILTACRERNALRAVVCQIMTNPDPSDKPAVDYCLQNSKRVSTFLESIGWQ